MPVLFIAHAGFQRAKHPKLALDRYPAMMGHLRNISGNGHIIIIGGRCFTICFKRAIHHHRGKAILNSCHTGSLRIAVILMHTNGNMRKHRNQPLYQILQHQIAGIITRPAAGLNNHRCVQLVCCCQNGQTLFHIINIKSRDTVIMFGCMIQKLS